MTVGIRKCLDLGPAIENSTQHLNGAGTLQKVLDTRARWIRTWISWARAMPAPGTYDWSYIALVDSQIATARANGLFVVLTNWEFPRWSNGTQNVDPNTYAYDDRYQGAGAPLKALEQGVPITQLGAGGYWGQWVQFLIDRYRGYGWGVVLEVMNEPNYQWWPQQNSGGSIISGTKAAEMMHTANAINAFYGYPLPLAGPASSDTRRGSSRSFTRYDHFLANVKMGLQSYNWRGVPMFIWSHHNYGDIERSEYVAYSAVYSTLLNWWRGWSPTVANGSDPGIWMTEGGCRLGEASNNLDTQAARVWEMYQIMHFARGSSMFTNYLLHSTPSYNTGLLNFPPDATRRPVWTSFYNMEPNA